MESRNFCYIINPPQPEHSFAWQAIGFFWVLVKTFLPGIITASVTGTIATLAYFVARSQREIATNKYNLDLFDKRWDVNEKIVRYFDIIEGLSWLNPFLIHRELCNIKQDFQKAVFLFPEITGEDITSFYDLVNSYNEVSKKSQPSTSTPWGQNEAVKLKNEKIQKLGSLQKKSVYIKEKINSSLNVPQIAYVPSNVEKYIKKYFCKILRFLGVKI